MIRNVHPFVDPAELGGIRGPLIRADRWIRAAIMAEKSGAKYRQEIQQVRVDLLLCRVHIPTLYSISG